jgi:hypothetical protein
MFRLCQEIPVGRKIHYLGKPVFEVAVFLLKKVQRTDPGHIFMMKLP